MDEEKIKQWRERMERLYPEFVVFIGCFFKDLDPKILEEYGDWNSFNLFFIEEVQGFLEIRFEGEGRERPSCCGGIPLDEDGRCPICGEVL